MLRPVQRTLLSPEQGGGSEYWQIRKSGITNIFQHVISGQGSARSELGNQHAFADRINLFKRKIEKKIGGGQAAILTYFHS
jgi:hypothetical protein